MFGQENVVVYIIILLIIFICAKIYCSSDSFQLKCVVSSVDGNIYCVREREKIDLASDTLAHAVRNCKTLVSFLVEKYPTNDGVTRLSTRFSSTKFSETLPTSVHTAYSENKGEKLAFCLNKHKNKGGETSLIDANTLMFVAIHELSHIMTVSEGHPQIFWDNFKFLLGNAVEIGIYNPIDYKKKPTTYCGMTLSDNPYYDL